MSLNVSFRKRRSRRYWLGKENKNIKPSVKEKLSKKLSSKKRAKQKQKTCLSSYFIKTVFVVSCIVLVSLCLGRASYLGRYQEDKRELLNQSALSQVTNEPSTQPPTALSQESAKESAKAQESEVEFLQLSEEVKKLCSIFDMRNSTNSTLSTQDLLSIKGFPTQLGQAWCFSLSCGGTQVMEELLQNCKDQGGYQLEYADFLDLHAQVFSALIKEEKSGEIFLLCAQDLNQKELKGEVYLVQLEHYEQAEETEL